MFWSATGLATTAGGGRPLPGPAQCLSLRHTLKMARSQSHTDSAGSFPEWSLQVGIISFCSLFSHFNPPYTVTSAINMSSIPGF